MAAKRPRFQIYKSRSGWRWRLRSANNRVTAQGEAHTRAYDAKRACEQFIRLTRMAAAFNIQRLESTK